MGLKITIDHLIRSKLFLNHWTVFQTLDVLETLCTSAGYPWLRLDGQTPTSKRQQLVERFNSPYSQDCKRSEQLGGTVTETGTRISRGNSFQSCPSSDVQWRLHTVSYDLVPVSVPVPVPPLCLNPLNAKRKYLPSHSMRTQHLNLLPTHPLTLGVKGPLGCSKATRGIPAGSWPYRDPAI